MVSNPDPDQNPEKAVVPVQEENTDETPKASVEKDSVEEEKKTEESTEKHNEVKSSISPEKEQATEKSEDQDPKDHHQEDHEDEETEDEDETHDDHVEEEHDGHEDDPTDYESMGLEELVSLLEETVQQEDISSIRKKVALIKVTFLKKHKSKQEDQLETIAVKEEEDHEIESSGDDLEARFNEAFKIYSKKRKTYLEKQEKQKDENLEAKKLILEELKALIESEESLKKTYDDFKELQDKWKAIGMVPKSEVNNLWRNYHFYVERFFDKVKINKELRDLDLKKNLESKIELCEKTEELLLEPSILKSFKQLQLYHRQWKEIGPVPQDKRDEIWERFRTATDKINQARRDHYSKLKEEQEKNYASKTTLCEKAEEILQRENKSIRNWQDNTREISELLKIWKTLGPAPRKQNDEIWERFKTSLDTFFAGKKEFFQQIKEEQQHNYNLKLDLCAQAEAMKSNTDWKKTTYDLIALQKEWKKIGPVPRKYSDKIWHRFRAACDEFFHNKEAYFANIKQHEADNLKAKEALIKKVENFDFSDKKNENFETLKEFQRAWTEIGHVPFKEKDRLQQAFRKAIDNKLDQLKISKTELQAANFKQRFEKIKEKPGSNRILRNERNFLVGKMKKLEEEVQLLENNMGFLAQSKKADLLKAEFMKKIETAKKEVDLLREKIKFLEREAE